jgi:Na+/proline symporter
MSGVLIGVVVYVLIQFVIGTLVSRRMTGEADYILAGRRLGFGLVTFSVFATYFGAEAIVATGGSVYDKGLAGALVDPIAYASAILVTGVVFAGLLWKRGLTTFADLFRQRYSAGVERLVVVMLLPGSIIWAAAQIRAFGQVLSANSSMSLFWTITIAAVLVGAYSVVGGLLADAVTDTIQGLAVMLGLVVLGWAVAEHMGGISAGLAKVQPEKLDLIEPQDGVLAVLERLSVPICGTIVAVELISRFLGARSASVAAWGTSVGGALYLVMGMIPIFLGLMGPIVMPGIEDPEQTVAKLAEEFLPGGLHIVFVGAVISAILSTVHAALHAPAAQISHNIVLRVLPDVTERQKLWSVRLTVMGLTVFAYVIAVLSHSIRELVETASAFGGAGLFVVALFALFTRFGGAASAYAGTIAGLVVWAALKYLTDSSYPYLSALLASTVAYVGVALWQRQRLLTAH